MVNLGLKGNLEAVSQNSNIVKLLLCEMALIVIK